MSAYAELKAGTPATAFMSLLGRTVLAVASTRNFPPPDGGQWTGEKANEVAVAFITHDRAQRIIDWLALTATDDATLAALLQGVVRNFLRDLGRSTEMGRLVVRLRRALKTLDRFVQVPGDRWAIADGPTDASEVGPDALVAAAAQIHVVFQPWSPTARRNAPFADAASINALIDAVLTAAKGSLRPGDIAHAVAPSLQVFTGIVLTELDPGDHPDTLEDLPGLDQVGDTVVNRARALEVCAQLSDRERIAVAHHDLTARQLGPLIGLGHSQAAVVANRAVEILREELLGEDNGQEVAEMVVQIARLWCDARTEPDGVTYIRE